MDRHDSVLARRWRNGDPGALSLVAERYADALGAIAYGIVGDVTLTEDVVQETFVRAANSIHTLKDANKLGGFLAVIARNVATDMVRKRSRKTPAHVAPPAPNTPSHQASLGELDRALHSAVEQLPADQRDLFLMKYVSGMRYTDIARALGMTDDAVGQKLWRIRKKLQQHLEDFKP